MEGFLEDFLTEEQIKKAQDIDCVEVEIVYMVDSRVPCYDIIRMALPTVKKAKMVQDQIEASLEKNGATVLNRCRTTWNVYEFLESCYEVCHNAKYIKKLLKYLTKGE